MSPRTLLKNVHLGLEPPGPSQYVNLVKGDYEYWHYCCDGTDDRGWGCGYRTLQTVCSWVRLQRQHSLLCPTPHEPSNTSAPPTVSPVQKASPAVASDDMSKVDDVRLNTISVIGCGDISDRINQCTASVDYDASITLIASGNMDQTQSSQTKCEDGCDEDSNSRIVVLSSGNVDYCSESENSMPAPTEGLQVVCNQKCDSSDLRVISGRLQTMKEGLLLPFSGNTVETSQESMIVQHVPSLPEIQKALVLMGDKPGHFVGSRQWIGSYEVCVCLDYFYDVPCKIIHISRGAELKHHLSTLCTHFSTLGSPVMMGGDSDASSKGIVGVCTEPAALLVVDPHYSGQAKSAASLQGAAWVKWVLVEEFHPTSFYNVCLPQLAAKAS